ncbi:unnamed protein product [Ectocarpus sp. 6 AP-2014]
MHKGRASPRATPQAINGMIALPGCPVRGCSLFSTNIKRRKCSGNGWNGYTENPKLRRASRPPKHGQAPKESHRNGPKLRTQRRASQLSPRASLSYNSCYF